MITAQNQKHPPSGRIFLLYCNLFCFLSVLWVKPLILKVRHLQNATSKLVAAAQGQNPRAQRLLFERYAPQMLGVCRSYLKQIALAEDALSQGFYKAFKHIGQLKKAALFESWLRRIMVNESLSLLRKNSSVTLEYELEGQLEFSVPPDAPNHFAVGLRMNFD